MRGRFQKAHRQEERSVLVLAEGRDGRIGRDTIGIRLVRHILADERRAGAPTSAAFLSRCIGFAGSFAIAAARPLDRFQRPRRKCFRPRNRVLFSDMENLSDGHGHVTVVLEMLRQCEGVFPGCLPVMLS